MIKKEKNPLEKIRIGYPDYSKNEFIAPVILTENDEIASYQDIGYMVSGSVFNTFLCISI